MKASLSVASLLRRMAGAIALLLVAGTAGAGAAPGLGSVRLADWPTYGQNSGHTFSAPTTLTKAGVQTLAPAWFFKTGDAVTANPIIVGRTVYVGSWDGCFYAIDAATGAMRWGFGVDLDQPSLSPQPSPGPCPRHVLRKATDVTTDGGIITSSAYFLPAQSARPDLVIFGAGYTIYAVRATDGRLFWKHKYPGTGLNPLTLAPNAFKPNDESRIFSSPAVVGDTVVFSIDSDGENGFRGYLVGAKLTDGSPRWVRELDVPTPGGAPLNDGCGNVWGSPTIVTLAGSGRAVEVVGLADCNFKDLPAYNERVLAVDVHDGSIVWVFKPPRTDKNCDYDFGATVNYGNARDGSPFLGIGGKDGTYYRLDPSTGHLIWKRNVVFGGFSGGFIGTTAFDGNRVFGATALGDFGRFEGFGSVGCTVNPKDPLSYKPRDELVQEPSIHAFNLNGTVAWSGYLSQSFGPTTVAGGMTFVGTGITHQLQIRSAANGALLKLIQMPFACDSGITVSGEALFFGVGSSEQGAPDGVLALWPFGVLRSP